MTTAPLKLLCLITLLIPGCLYAAYDSTSFVTTDTKDISNLCYYSGDPKAFTFNSRKTTAKCSDQFTDGEYVVVGISSDGGSAKTMYCQKLICNYGKGDSTTTHALPANS